MTDATNILTWLPAHQTDAVYTLGYVDSRVHALGELMVRYTEQQPMELTNVNGAGRAYVAVAGIKPVPAAASRIFADALNQMRSAVEHAIFAEVENMIDRPLTQNEQRVIEMPAASTEEKFDAWLHDRRRSSIGPLQPGAPLPERLRALQPFNQSPASSHPMSVLAEHTNFAKHRAPHVASTLLGAVIPDFDVPGVKVATGPDRPLASGDVLLEGPEGVLVPLSIWPKMSVQRPTSGSWHLILDELELVHDWVRTVALPMIVVGDTDVPRLPAELQTEIGYDTIADALAVGSQRSAAKRVRIGLQAELLRRDIPNMLTLFPGPPKVDARTAALWVSSLSDDDLLDRVERLQPGTTIQTILANLPVFREFVNDAIAYADAAAPSTGDSNRS